MIRRVQQIDLPKQAAPAVHRNVQHALAIQGEDGVGVGEVDADRIRVGREQGLARGQHVLHGRRRAYQLGAAGWITVGGAAVQAMRGAGRQVITQGGEQTVPHRPLRNAVQCAQQGVGLLGGGCVTERGAQDVDFR
ncbi:hypothetical protein D3C72_1193990 [compost metagenome]